MQDNPMLRRILRAAESWGYKITGQPVSIVAYSEPCCGENGTYTSEIQLRATPGSNARLTRLRCIVTLEPDGALGCVAAEDFSA
jgi:hypothetical protein